MTLHFENETTDTFSFSCLELGEKLLDFVMDFTQCPYEADVSLLLTTSQEIHRINQEQRGIDKPTDVLSFPMNSFSIAGDYSFLEHSIDGFDPDSGELLLGDIIISTEHVKAQASEYGHSEEREFAFLMVHSLLHLIGYDHIKEEDASQMEALQRNILEQMGILR